VPEPLLGLLSATSPSSAVALTSSSSPGCVIRNEQFVPSETSTGWGRGLIAKSGASPQAQLASYEAAHLKRLTEQLLDLICPHQINAQTGESQRRIIGTSRRFRHVLLDLWWVATKNGSEEISDPKYYLASPARCVPNLYTFLEVPDSWSTPEDVAEGMAKIESLNFVFASSPDVSAPYTPQLFASGQILLPHLFHFQLREANTPKPEFNNEPEYTIVRGEGTNSFRMLRYGKGILEAKRNADGEKMKAADEQKQIAQELARRTKVEQDLRSELARAEIEVQKAKSRSPTPDPDQWQRQQPKPGAGGEHVPASALHCSLEVFGQLQRDSNNLHAIAHLTSRFSGSNEQEAVLSATQQKGTSTAKLVFGIPGIYETVKRVEENASFGIVDPRTLSDWSLNFVTQNLVAVGSDEERKAVDTANRKGLPPAYGVMPGKGRQIDHLAVLCATVCRVRDKYRDGANVADELRDLEAAVADILLANIETVKRSSLGPNAQAATPLVVKEVCAGTNSKDHHAAESTLSSCFALAPIIGVKHDFISQVALMNVFTDVARAADTTAKAYRLNGPYVTLYVGAARTPDLPFHTAPTASNAANEIIKTNAEFLCTSYSVSSYPPTVFRPAPKFSDRAIADAGGSRLSAAQISLAHSLARQSQAPQAPFNRSSPAPLQQPQGTTHSGGRFSQPPGSFGCGNPRASLSPTAPSRVGLPLGTNALFASRNCAVAAATAVVCAALAGSDLRKLEVSGLARRFLHSRDFATQSELIQLVFRKLGFKKGARPAGNTVVGEFFRAGANDAVSIVEALARKVALCAGSPNRIGDLFSVSPTRDNSRALLAMLLFEAAAEPSAPGHWTTAVRKTKSGATEWVLLDVGTATPLGSRVKGFAGRKVFYVHGERALGSTQAGKFPLLGYGPALGAAAPLPPRRTTEDKRQALVATIAGRSPLLEQERPAAPKRRHRRRAGKGSGAKKRGPASEKVKLAATPPPLPPPPSPPPPPPLQVPAQKAEQPPLKALCDVKKPTPAATYNHAALREPGALLGDELYPIERAPTSPVFRQGHLPEPREVALFPAGYLLNLNFHQHSADGYVPETSAQKISLLRRFQEFLELHPLAQVLPLVDATLYFLDFCTNRSGWQPQTLFRSMNTLASAFKNLGCYCDQNISVDLFTEPRWRGHFREIKQVQSRSQPRDQTFALWEQVRAAVQICQAADPSSALALLLMWFTCARPGCVTKLRRRDIEFTSPVHFSITFGDGKGSRFGQIYTVPSKMPEDAASFVQAQLAPLSPGDLLFPTAPPNAPRQRQARLLQILREVDPSLNLRAMRRGSLQALAAVESDLAKIRQFSGHTSDETLLRYLDWGKHARQRHEVAQHLAAALTSSFLPAPPSRTPPPPYAGQGSSNRQV